MANANHTPGPWVVKGEADIYDGRGDYVAACYAGDLDEQEANARLIAACPDLLGALRAFADLPLPEQDGFTLYTRADIQAARAAISKAEG